MADNKPAADDTLLLFLRASLPDELAAVLESALQSVSAGAFEAVFALPDVQVLLGHRDTAATENVKAKDFPLWSDYIFQRLGLVLSKRQEDAAAGGAAEADIREGAAYKMHLFFLVGVAALYAFIQSNVTGPPLGFSPAEVVLPRGVAGDREALARTREELVGSLAADGVAAYKLTPNIELLCLAETILVCPPLQKYVGAAVAWARLRVNFMHQRLLSEGAASLQKSIYEDLEVVEKAIGEMSEEKRRRIPDLHVYFLLERAAVHTHHGLDRKAKADLDKATAERRFEFLLTGLMGKRTKFQQKDTSQLLVLAKSADATTETNEAPATDVSKPKDLELNDDTILERISFTEKPSSAADAQTESSLPPGLAALDPSDQPLLDPLDSVILLSLASSITNTNPADGITREETIPYATRVLEGGSSNWQVYTQALLVRSRIEGYKSRTTERGLLQLQALVDQVIAETSGAPEPAEAAANGEVNGHDYSTTQVTSFLPKAKEGESAPVSERLRYIFPLCSPSRWELEAELAARWVSIGGLRSALEIYERLEMWAEAALCWAATDKEGRAKKIVRRQLFHATAGPDADSTADIEEEKWEGPARDPPPADAPRLYCILGDIDKDLSMYETAWEVSGKRYARAQRSIGRQYIAERDYEKAAHAYELSLQINALNHPAWFALGCAYLELQQFKKAVEAFSRCVQLDDEDAEAWSNLAAALLHLRPKAKAIPSSPDDDDLDAPRESSKEKNEEEKITSHPRQDALKAFKRAANLKHDNSRIWSNVLAVAASTSPPAWQDVIQAQKRICDIRGGTDGEACVDAEVLDMLVKHTVQEIAAYRELEGTKGSGNGNASANGSGNAAAAAEALSRPGLPRLVNELVEKTIKPLITHSPALWTALSTFYLHTGRPSSALEAQEKAWRAVTSRPKWEGSEEGWDQVVLQTVELVNAYEMLGGRERTEGLAAGSGELVARDWKFKARSAVRSVMGRGKENWEGGEGWEKLVGALEELKGRE